MSDLETARKALEPRLIHLICGLRQEQVTEAVAILLDYIDASRAPQPAPVIGEADAMALFKTFVRDNAKALRLVAHWGDGACGALHEVLLNELQGKSLFGGPRASGPDGAFPLFPEDGGIPT